MDTGAAIEAETPAAPGWRPASSWGGHIGATLRLGLPLVGAQLAQMAINVTDTIMVGRLGAVELAAAVLGTQAFFLVWMFGAGFAQGLMPLAASAEGRGDVRGVRRSVRMGFWVVAAYGLAAMLPLWHLEAILLALGQEPATAALAGHFMRILQWGMIPALLIAGARSALSVLSRAGVVLIVTLAVAILNAAVGYVLIFGRLGMPALGLSGAAIASVTVNTAGAATMLVYLARGRRPGPYEFFARLWRPDWPAFFEIVRIGWPISTTIIAEVGLFATSSIMMGWLGTTTLAAHGIALQLASIAFMVPLGLSQAATVRVGLAYGRGDWIGLRRAGWSALGLCIAAGAAGAALFWAMPHTLVGLYLDRSEAQSAAVLAAGVQLLAVAAAFQLFDCLQVVSSGLLRGLRDTRMPMLIALFSYWVIGMPVAYLLAFRFGLGGLGIWAGLAGGLLAAAILMTGRFALRERFGLTPA